MSIRCKDVENGDINRVNLYRFHTKLSQRLLVMIYCGLMTPYGDTDLGQHWSQESGVLYFQQQQKVTVHSVKNTNINAIEI